MNYDELVALLKSKNVNKFVHFHTDHWEPYTGNWGHMGTESATSSAPISCPCISCNAEAIMQFIDETKNNPYFNKMTLFYNHPIRTKKWNDFDNIDNDLLGFENLRPVFWNRYAHAIKKCVEETEHEFQVHIHHEAITNGKYFKYKDLKWPKDDEVIIRDTNRFERHLKTTLNDFRKITGLELVKWSFIHGVWALNASDINVCNIESEIEILMKNGCIGDFSMPAGRRWVDSKEKNPHTVIPNNVPKGYDYPDAKVKLIEEETKGEKRFLIWNQNIPFTHCSIDHYGSDEIANALNNWQETLEIWIKNSPIVGNIAFVKTHAHSMNRIYWNEGKNRTYEDPKVINLFKKLESICSDSGVEYLKWTVGEVIKHMENTNPSLEYSFNNLENCIFNINRKLCQIGRDRLDNMGEYESGLFEYYSQRVRGNQILSGMDIPLVKQIIDRYDNDISILEVAAGCGQVSYLLEEYGFNNIEFCEINKRRTAFAKDIKDKINSNIIINDCDYRDLNLEKYNLIVIGNARNDMIGVEDYEILKGCIENNCDIIMYHRYYGRDDKIFDKLEENGEIIKEIMTDINGTVLNNYKENEIGLIKYHKSRR